MILSEPITEIIAMLLKRETSRIDTIESEPAADCGAALSVVMDGKLLSPRETRKWIVSTYEKEIGRKLSKKEQNHAMQTVRRTLSKATPDFEDVSIDQTTGRPAIVKGGVTWANDAPFGDVHE
jgi:hypothetical protein